MKTNSFNLTPSCLLSKSDERSPSTRFRNQYLIRDIFSPLHVEVKTNPLYLKNIRNFHETTSSVHWDSSYPSVTPYSTTFAGRILLKFLDDTGANPPVPVIWRNRHSSNPEPASLSLVDLKGGATNQFPFFVCA